MPPQQPRPIPRQPALPRLQKEPRAFNRPQAEHVPRARNTASRPPSVFDRAPREPLPLPSPVPPHSHAATPRSASPSSAPRCSRAKFGCGVHRVKYCASLVELRPRHPQLPPHRCILALARRPQAFQLQRPRVPVRQLALRKRPPRPATHSRRSKSIASSSRICPPHLFVVPPCARKRPICTPRCTCPTTSLRYGSCDRFLDLRARPPPAAPPARPAAPAPPPARSPPPPPPPRIHPRARPAPASPAQSPGSTVQLRPTLPPLRARISRIRSTISPTCAIVVISTPLRPHPPRRAQSAPAPPHPEDTAGSSPRTRRVPKRTPPPRPPQTAPGAPPTAPPAEILRTPQSQNSCA